MAVPIFDIRDAVADALESELSLTFEKRITAYTKRSEVEAGKWLVTAAGEATEIKGRAVDQSKATIDVGFQIALPEATDADPDPLENADWFAAQMQKVENVKSEFRPDGLLRDADFAGFTFIRFDNNPIYRPDLLHDYQIFQSVIRLELIGEVS